MVGARDRAAGGGEARTGGDDRCSGGDARERVRAVRVGGEIDEDWTREGIDETRRVSRYLRLLRRGRVSDESNAIRVDAVER